MDNPILFQIVNAIAIISFIYFAIAVVYILVFSIASMFPLKKREPKEKKNRKFAVMIPAYKADNIIIETAQHALDQDYPRSLYEIFVICDSMQPETMDKLHKLAVHPVVVEFENSNKAKSLNKCMEQIEGKYDVALILDADNIITPTFLKRINEGFNNGYRVVQGHRVAKNLQTDFAVLDAASEEINNHIFRKGHRVLGVSSALIGSGMALEYDLYKSFMKDIDAVGEDKEMEIKLLSNKIKIDYLPNAWVYDEKTAEAQNFRKQRSRWIAAQTEYVNDHFFKSLKAFLFKGNFDYFDKAYQFVMPPRILMLGVLFIVPLALFLVQQFTTFVPTFFTCWTPWLALFILTDLSLLFALPKKFYTGRTLKAVLSIPLAFIMILGSITQFKKARKHFIATEHKYTENKD